MWIITFAVNAYDQEGDYFDRAFDKKPTVEELNKLGYDGEHLINGASIQTLWISGRIGIENTWYFLTEVKSGEKYKHS